MLRADQKRNPPLDDPKLYVARPIAAFDRSDRDQSPLNGQFAGAKPNTADTKPAMLERDALNRFN